LPLGSAPLVKTGVILSLVLDLLAVHGQQVARRDELLSEKYSVSTTSKELGWVDDAARHVVLS